VDGQAAGPRCTAKLSDDFHDRIVVCHVDELRPHPSYVRHHLTVSASQFSTLVELGDLAFREPITITPDRTILDGYGRVKLARSKGRATLLCMVRELGETQPLQYLLQKHRRSTAWNAFTRILLALDLEPGLVVKARSNQCAGGQNKGSSNLTEVDRVDVRSEIAAAAGVSVGNVIKVKQLRMTARPELMQALLSGEISIHRAWVWSKELPDKQLEALRFYQSEKGIKKTIRTLVGKHRSKTSPAVTDLSNLIRQLSALDSSQFDPVQVVLIKAPVRAVFLTEELSRDLRSQEELTLTCATNSR
jgi:hypothetical protein